MGEGGLGGKINVGPWVIILGSQDAMDPLRIPSSSHTWEKIKH